MDAVETNETGETIATATREHLKELALAQQDENYLPCVLKNLSVYMSVRAANEKKSNRFLDDWRSKELENIFQSDKAGNQPERETHNFSVLLVMPKDVVEAMNVIQKRLEEDDKLRPQN